MLEVFKEKISLRYRVHMEVNLIAQIWRSPCVQFLLSSSSYQNGFSSWHPLFFCLGQLELCRTWPPVAVILPPHFRMILGVSSVAPVWPATVALIMLFKRVGITVIL
jgi:hypothetical protein